MIDIKLLAVDLDETFLDEDAKVSEKNRAAITLAVNRGIIFVVATGRIRYRIPDDVISIPGLRFLVSCNGANVIDLHTEKILFEDPIPSGVAMDIVRKMRQYPIYVEIYSQGYAVTDRQFLTNYYPHIYSPGRRIAMGRGIHVVDDFAAYFTDPLHIIDKINIPYIPDDLNKEVSEIFQRPEISTTQSLPQNAEINHFTANKAEGLRFLCKTLGVLPEQVLAFGDADNDLNMLRFAGHSVAMENASCDLKEIARYVTKSNSNDGVAWFIENYVLK